MSKPKLPETQASKAKDKYRVTNWPEYDRALVRRGDITVWFEEDFLRQHWRGQSTGKRGAPLIYSDAAIQVLLMLKAVFKLALSFGGRTGLFADALDGAGITCAGSHADVAACQSVASRDSSQRAAGALFTW